MDQAEFENHVLNCLDEAIQLTYDRNPPRYAAAACIEDMLKYTLDRANRLPYESVSVKAVPNRSNTFTVEAQFLTRKFYVEFELT